MPVALVCTQCKTRNYQTKKKRGQALELKKYCKKCGEHTLHRDSK